MVNENSCVAYIICVVCKVIHISKTLGSTNVKFERFNIMYRKHIVDLCARSFIHMPMKHTEYCKHATLFIPILTVHFSASYIQLTYFKQDTYLKHTSKETCNIFFFLWKIHSYTWRLGVHFSASYIHLTYFRQYTYLLPSSYQK
jgi:hypothetical protein